MLIVLIIFILLPSIFTFAVSHISANKLQYLRYQIKQVRERQREREKEREREHEDLQNVLSCVEDKEKDQ